MIKVTCDICGKTKEVEFMSMMFMGAFNKEKNEDNWAELYIMDKGKEREKPFHMTLCEHCVRNVEKSIGALKNEVIQ